MSTQAGELEGSANSSDRRRLREVWVTLAGLPLEIELEWPFHRSASGADFYLLHGDVRVTGSAGLHALVAVQLTLTVKEALPSL